MPTTNMTKTRRLLTSLASVHVAHSGPAPSLIPPYAHATSHQPSVRPTEPSSSFRPPYAHSVDKAKAKPSVDKIKASKRFVVLPDRAPAFATEHWTAWAKSVLSNDASRAELERLWVQTLEGLEHVHSTGNRVPEVAFHSLSEALRGSSLKAIRAAGVLVLRDVVPDSEAIQHAKDILLALEQRDDQPLYWHQSLVTARSSPSLLSATSQIIRAVSDVAEDNIYIRADTVQEGIKSNSTLLTDFSHHSKLWTIDESSAPATSIQAHLTLSPTLSSASQYVVPSALSAIYASLRPLFHPAHSKISFYSPADYLSTSNWSLIDPAHIPASPTEVSVPHLDGVALPQLNPGDLVVRHSATPVEGESDQLFLPVSPLVNTAKNAQFVKDQRAAFEAGLPPPHVQGGVAALEDEGAESMIATSGGKRAMGY